MKRIYLLSIFLIFGLFSFAQTYNAQVENVINTVNLDSLIYQMRNLSGEDEVVINDETTTIEHRVSNLGNNLAAQYIYETLENIGLEPTWDLYSMNGVNVYAVQEGSVYPDEYYMICAHYDAVDNYCADDNASGSAAVIEAARILSSMEFEYSIIYALWDEEEIGLIGSADYAAIAASNGDVIHSVINMDMIAWDGDEDMVAEIHSSYTANSNELSDYVVEIDEIYSLAIEPNVIIPGAGGTDHSSFWNNGYAAVVVSEEYYGGDFNPYYHTAQDRIAVLNMEYFHEMSKLCIASLTSFCQPILNTSTIEKEISVRDQIHIYPNPAQSYTHITCQTSSSDNTQVTLLNNMGQSVLILHQGEVIGESLNLVLPLNSLAKGLYFVKMETGTTAFCQKLIIE